MELKEAILFLALVIWALPPENDSKITPKFRTKFVTSIRQVPFTKFPRTNLRASSTASRTAGFTLHQKSCQLTRVVKSELCERALRIINFRKNYLRPLPGKPGSCRQYAINNDDDEKETVTAFQCPSDPPILLEGTVNTDNYDEEPLVWIIMRLLGQHARIRARL